MNSSILNFRNLAFVAFLTASVTIAAASPKSGTPALPSHSGGNVANTIVAVSTPIWPVPVPPSGNIAVSTPIWPVPVPPSGNVAVSTPIWPVPVPPTGNVAVSTPIWPVPVPPSGNVATTANGSVTTA